MSSNSLKRIKQIRQKTGDQNFTSIPLGVDGLLVDMMSNLDLEEELKLGGNHEVVITQGVDKIEINEYYYDGRGEDRKRTHRVQISMSKQVSFYPLITKINGNDFEFMVDSSEDSDRIIVQPNKDSSQISQTEITMTLYQYNQQNQENIIHTKTILITGEKNNYNFIDYNISQEVDKS